MLCEIIYSLRKISDSNVKTIMSELRGNPLRAKTHKIGAKVMLLTDSVAPYSNGFKALADLRKDNFARFIDWQMPECLAKEESLTAAEVEGATVETVTPTISPADIADIAAGTVPAAAAAAAADAAGKAATPENEEAEQEPRTGEAIVEAFCAATPVAELLTYEDVLKKKLYLFDTVSGLARQVTAQDRYTDKGVVGSIRWLIDHGVGTDNWRYDFAPLAKGKRIWSPLLNPYLKQATVLNRLAGKIGNAGGVPYHDRCVPFAALIFETCFLKKEVANQVVENWLGKLKDPEYDVTKWREIVELLVEFQGNKLSMSQRARLFPALIRRLCLDMVQT